MAPVIEFLQANPLYAVAAVVLIIFFVFSLIKKAIKLVIVAVVLNIGFGYYVQDIAEDAYSKASKQIGSAVDTAKEVLDK